MKITSYIRVCMQVHMYVCVCVCPLKPLSSCTDPRIWRHCLHCAQGSILDLQIVQKLSIFCQQQLNFGRAEPWGSNIILQVHEVLQGWTVGSAAGVGPGACHAYWCVSMPPLPQPHLCCAAPWLIQGKCINGCGCTCLWVMGCFSPLIAAGTEENSSLSSTSVWFAECNSLWENGCLVFQSCPRDDHARENEHLSMRNLSAVSRAI